jgi:hypothetical protein
VPVESIAEDLLGLEVERSGIDCSGMLFPAERGRTTLLPYLLDHEGGLTTIWNEKGPSDQRRASRRAGGGQAQQA